MKMPKNVLVIRFLIALFVIFSSHSLAAQFASPEPLNLQASNDFILFDLENDGDLDVFVKASNAVNYFINQQAEGNEWVSRQLKLSGLNSVYSYDLESADLNGDQVDDLVILGGNGESAFISWYANIEDSLILQDSAHYFSYRECAAIVYTTFEDVDNDNDLDIIFSQGWSPVYVENVDGQGTLEFAYDFNGVICRGSAVQDLNKDGAVDLLLVANQSASAYYNDGQGNFKGQALASSDAQETDALATFINDSVFVHYRNFGTSGQIYEFSENAIKLLNNDQYDYQDQLLYHDFTNDGTLDLIRYPYPTTTNSSFLEFAQYNPQAFKFDLRINTYDISVEYAFPADFDQDGWDDLIIRQDGNLYWMRNLGELPSVSGMAYIDANENGVRDEGDYPLRNARITSPLSNQTAYTNEAGAYTLFAVPAVHEVSASSFNNNVQAVTTQPINVDLTTVAEATGVDFGFVYFNEVKDLGVSLFSWFTRCDSEVPFYLTYENKGTLPASGQVVLNLDASTSFVSAKTAPASINANQIIWNYTDLGPTSKTRIDLVLKMPSADVLGEMLRFEVRIEDQVNDFSNSDVYEARLRCSFDPNDKQVNPIGSGPENLTLLEDNVLKYLLRFQNTGNDTAFNVRLTDALHPLLDINTFEVIDASHSYRAEIEDRTLSFFFDNILLPDSTTNEAASQGYVQFQIQTKADIADGDVVSNQAKIYFDRNVPIVTNEVRNTFVSFICTPIQTQIEETICTGNTFEGYSSSGIYTDVFTTSNGCDSSRVLNLQVLPLNEINLDTTICAGESVLGYTQAGTYIDTLYAAGSCSTVRTLQLALLPLEDPSCLVPVTNVETDQITIYPNPVQDEVHIQFDGFSRKAIELRLLDMQGRTVLQKSTNISRLMALSLEEIAAGMYFLQVHWEGNFWIQKVVKVE